MTTLKTSNKNIYMTKQGRLYIKPNEFFKLPKIVNALKDWMQSDLVKEMDMKKKKLTYPY